MKGSEQGDHESLAKLEEEVMQENEKKPVSKLSLGGKWK